MGFDYITVQEHLATHDGYGPSVPIFVSLLAERTSTIRIGSSLYVLPLHNAVRLAQETAVLDHLSDGRLEVGVGAGHRLAEFQILGYSPKTRPSRMQEGLDVLRLAWTERPFSYHGDYYHFDDVMVNPPPLQQPHPPLWVGASAPAAARRAGLAGANLQSISIRADFYNAYFAGLAAAGVRREAARISKGVSITVTDQDPQVVWRRNRSQYFERWDFYRRVRAEMGDPDLQRSETPNGDAYRDAELIGDATAVTETLARMRDAQPFTDLVHLGPASGIDIKTEAYQSLKLFAEHVMPVVKGWRTVRAWPELEA
jgi:alkanesulfonate monooxygenase SsuD/methylene tetrahydromethanopterin reductase-like flavin-dependent oxidoreductase (luciferase family)